MAREFGMIFSLAWPGIQFKVLLEVNWCWLKIFTCSSLLLAKAVNRWQSLDNKDIFFKTWVVLMHLISVECNERMFDQKKNFKSVIMIMSVLWTDWSLTSKCLNVFILHHITIYEDFSHLFRNCSAYKLSSWSKMFGRDVKFGMMNNTTLYLPAITYLVI